MRESVGEDAISGAFEELPALLVVLIAISLFSVSLAHATMSWDDNQEYNALQEDCQTFARIVRNSNVLCGEKHAGTYDLARIQNISNKAIMDNFNSTLLGFEYRILIQPVGNYSAIIFQSSEMSDNFNIATFHTSVNLINNGKVSGARLIVSIWEAPQ